MRAQPFDGNMVTAGVDVAVRFIQWVGQNFPGHEWTRKAGELVSPPLICRLTVMHGQAGRVTHTLPVPVVLSRGLGSWRVPTVHCKVCTVSS